MRYRFRPLQWRGPSTAGRRGSPFQTTYPATLELLFREADKLGAGDLVIEADIADRDIRTDGLPRSNARFGTHPGVVISLDSRHGPLRYATDAYTEWQANLRAVALSLEALRAVDRYGVSSSGEQYAGWKALPAAAGDSGFATAADAVTWMRAEYGRLEDDAAASMLSAPGLHRRLAKRLHPDTAGSREGWDTLDAARQVLEKEGLL
jgi:hypothetical protein